MLVRKKDGSLCFCINFRRLNTLIVKDSHLLCHICETLESLAGMAHYSTIDLNSGFWQVPMDEESKQYTAFTLGSMGLYECESMPFGLCNAPPTFQRLMLNCLGELNITYYLIYLDDVIIFSQMEEEHLEWMRVVFDRFREHGLKLKLSKCEVFKTEINYLAHHVSKRGYSPPRRIWKPLLNARLQILIPRLSLLLGLLVTIGISLRGLPILQLLCMTWPVGKTKTRSQNILTYHQRLGRLLTTSKLHASKLLSWLFLTLTNPSCWK